MTREEFETKVRILRPELIGYACSMLKDYPEAEDVVQDTLLKLWSKKEILSNYKSFEALSFVILRRLILNKLRADGNKVSISEIQEKFDSFHHYEEDFCDEILEGLEALPTIEQAVMRMKHLEGMETEEIASLIGSNPGAVRTALSRARKKLRERFSSRS